jgi:hypothetical protein
LNSKTDFSKIGHGWLFLDWEACQRAAGIGAKRVAINVSLYLTTLLETCRDNPIKNKKKASIPLYEAWTE